MGAKFSIPKPPNEREVRRKRLQLEKVTDLPTIPFLKYKEINEDMAYFARTSIWMHNYKRAFRGFLRKDPRRNDAGTLYTIHCKSVAAADLLGQPKDSYSALIDATVDRWAPLWVYDAKEHLKEKKLITVIMKETTAQFFAECTVADVHRQMVDQVVNAVGKKMYDRFNAGIDIDVSDDELSPAEREKAIQAKEAARLEAAAKRREEASKWQSEASKVAQEDAKRQQAVLQAIEDKKLREKRKLEADMNI